MFKTTDQARSQEEKLEEPKRPEAGFIIIIMIIMIIIHNNIFAQYSPIFFWLLRFVFCQDELNVFKFLKDPIYRSFPRTFEAPHLKDEAVRTTTSRSRSIKLVVIAFALLLIVVHLAIFVWEEVKLPGSTGSLLTEPFWYIWNIFF